MLERIGSSQQLAEWIAFFEREPQGWQATNYAQANAAAWVVAHLGGKKGNRAFGMRDTLIWTHPDEKNIGRGEQSEAEQRSVMARMKRP